MHVSRIAFPLVFAALAGVAAGAGATALPAGTTAVPLAVVTNDRDTSVSRMQLMLTGNGSVSGIYMETSANADSSPKVDSGRVYPLSNIESSDGVVLGQGQGVKAIYLRGSIASAAGEGSLTIRYLTNGVFRHWSECKIGLQRVAPDDWQLVNAYTGQPIKQIRVKTWALGISTLGNVCPVGNA